MMARPDPFAMVAAQEEFVAAACAAVASWAPDAEALLHTLAAAHLDAANQMAPSRPRRWLKLHVTLRATLAAAVGTSIGALTWLRKQEQRLIDQYVELEASPSLTELQRLRLRRQLVPAAFERFQRVDQVIMLREEQGAFA